jgi:hypothetical protein
MGEWLTPRYGRFTSTKKVPVPTVKEAGWVRGPVWTGKEKISAPPELRTTDPSARRESLYRLRNPSSLNPYLIQNHFSLSVCVIMGLTKQLYDIHPHWTKKHDIQYLYCSTLCRVRLIFIPPRLL